MITAWKVIILIGLTQILPMGLQYMALSTPQKKILFWIDQQVNDSLVEVGAGVALEGGGGFYWWSGYWVEILKKMV